MFITREIPPNKSWRIYTFPYRLSLNDDERGQWWRPWDATRIVLISEEAQDIFSINAKVPRLLKELDKYSEIERIEFASPAPDQIEVLFYENAPSSKRLEVEQAISRCFQLDVRIWVQMAHLQVRHFTISLGKA